MFGVVQGEVDELVEGQGPEPADEYADELLERGYGTREARSPSRAKALG